MKVNSLRLLFAAVTALLLFLFSSLWWYIDQQRPLAIENPSLELPQTAKFVPNHASLTIHLMLNPNDFPAYTQVLFKTNNRKKILKGADELRNSLFAFAGLDFDKEISEWVGSEISFGLLETDEGKKPPAWVIAISSRDTDSAKLFLQEFWQPKSLKPTDLQISNKKVSEAITGKGDLLEIERNQLKSALINEDLLLIASGQEALQEALNVSQIANRNQLGNERLHAVIGEFGNGVALITASPTAFHKWLGAPLKLSQRNDLKEFVAAIGSDGRDLAVEGVLLFTNPLSEIINRTEQGLALLNNSGGPAGGLAVLSAPAQLIDQMSPNPLAQWIGPSIKKHLATSDLVGAKSITELTEGAFIWLEEPDGWVLGTEQWSPKVSKIDEILSSENLTKTELISTTGIIEAWSKLVTHVNNGEERLKAEVPLMVKKGSEENWWSGNLIALRQRNDLKALQPRLDQLNSLVRENKGTYQPSQQLAVGTASAQKLLKSWRPWVLVQASTGRSLNPIVKGLAIAMGFDKDIDPSSIYLNAKLSMD